ncbi:putative membrane dehydrogenase protein [Basidiobolus meristosporus CBS 931.73]|uniref:Putative membrane dehydrogenase protein n=1 Tax=Basidiobolus meristosporus CBS 931.73 TaxID=1314790 RepID=A0A1Y1YG13_9FUNG|nr:putative membrane dehydrogenase protein [Basidiobolus meristosporus CBS 931.73]|eukprot:ORX96666.1 putative membrane dehydrogenase protein [Basidiobolus meristosporus CBS 931.73]
MELMPFANSTRYDPQDPEVILLSRVVYLYVAFPIVVILASCVLTSPYGMLASNVPLGKIPGKLGWMLMEAMSPLTFLVSFFMPSSTHYTQPTVASYLFLTMWLTHYINRSFVSVWRASYRSPMPIITCLSAVFFNLGNAYMNGRWAAVFGDYPASYLTSTPFLLGTALFFAGFVGNILADNTLMNLRANYVSGKDKEQSKYKIPYGQLFEFISCPHYFFEIIEWTGYAIATQSVPGMLFAVCTASNLIPRAVQIHQWYNTTFADYPKSRKAVIPFLL